MSWLKERLGRGDTETELVERLRDGDEQAFSDLVDEHGATMLRVTRLYVRDRAVAEEVVQETWLAVLNGIDSFEGRSTLKTWIFRILANRAKTRAEREGRSVPLSAILATDAATGEPSLDPDRFFGLDHSQRPFHWAAPPRDWPHDRVLERETLELVRSTIDTLPDTQREVIRLRDVEGWDPEEVAEALEISDGNQRVLLHRARSKVRAALESYIDPELSPLMTQVLDDITCRELVELVTDYLEGALSDADRTRFDEHLEICGACRTYIEQMRLTIEASGRLTEQQALEPSARGALMDAFRDWNRSRPNPRL